MGVVYKAWHTQLDRPVALKVLPKDRLGHPGAVTRFRREMKAVGRLDHPNLVKAQDAGEENGVPFLVMEFLEGLDASRVVQRLGPLPIADACELVRQAAEGLEYACRQGVLHRDVKPSNLMLTPTGTVKVLDLGLAKLVHPTAEQEISHTGELLGTLEYMAPERIHDSRQADSQGDVYSLGATLYKLLTGQAPFCDKRYDTAAKKIVAVLQEAVPPPETLRPGLPHGLAKLLGQMLAKDRGARPTTPGEVANALRPLACGADLVRLYERACAMPSPVPFDSAIYGANPAVSLAPTASICATTKRREGGLAQRRLALLAGIGGIAAAILATFLLGARIK
jgi:serine/threonine protein kinase